jgi:hypothetical protein
MTIFAHLIAFLSFRAIDILFVFWDSRYVNIGYFLWGALFKSGARATTLSRTKGLSL